MQNIKNSSLLICENAVGARIGIKIVYLMETTSSSKVR